MNSFKPDKYFDCEVVVVLHGSIIAPDQNSAVGQLKTILYPMFPANKDNTTLTLAEFKPLKVVEHIIPDYQPGWIVKLFQDIPDVLVDDGSKMITIPAGAIGQIVSMRKTSVRPVTIRWYNLGCKTECDYHEFEAYGVRENVVLKAD